MTDVMAAMGLAQYERYSKLLERRKQIIQKYDEAFANTNIIVPKHYTDEYSSCGHLYITRVKGIDGKARAEIITKMAEQGIACNVHYKPLPMHTAYKQLGFDVKDYPNAYDYFINEITLPLHTCLTDEQVDYVIEKYKEIVKEYSV
jgi:dTDP-4-amino-4,6-dideoxygalactose transaminase